MEAFTENVISY